MPYEKVCLLVAMVVTLLLTVLMNGNFSHDARVAVVDLDNSAYTHELTTRINASEYMKVTSVLNSPVDVKTLFYEDKASAVVYFPPGLEKDRFTGTGTNVGVFYDQTNTAQNSNIRAALNEIVGLDNAAAQGDVGSTNDTELGQVSLADRELFNPQGSQSNTEVLGFLFFFSSMFFTFATIGMAPRLRLTHEMDKILTEGTPWDIILRLVPYGGCLIVAFTVGMAVLRIWGDLNFSGSLLTFLFIQLFYVMTVGMLSVFFGWTASNPGIASSRMILFIPGGFILGGATGPTNFFAPWVVKLSHVFPLTWEYHFTRDIIGRGAGLADISGVFGAFLLYMFVVALLFLWRFRKARRQFLAQQVEASHQKARLHRLAEELAEE